ncbi:MAG: hypothetical protein ACLFQ1_06940 [Halochromatium sp.]|uniref:hypothetical protein n=1 Tax=Halochromatium sp. TaxID=2049430 RepID=UPI00397D5F5F
MAEDVDVEIGLEVIAGQGGDAIEIGIGDRQRLQLRIMGEQTAVVGIDPHPRIALVHRVEQSAQLLPARDLHEALGLGIERLG